MIGLEQSRLFCVLPFQERITSNVQEATRQLPDVVSRVYVPTTPGHRLVTNRYSHPKSPAYKLLSLSGDQYECLFSGQQMMPFLERQHLGHKEAQRDAPIRGGPAGSIVRQRPPVC